MNILPALNDPNNYDQHDQDSLRKKQKGKEIDNSQGKLPPIKMSKLERAIYIEIKNKAENTIPFSSLYTYDVKGFLYHPGRSIAGAFFTDVKDNPAFNYLRPYPDLGLPPPFFFYIPIPFTLCSSSSGLLLCQDHSTGSFHVFNPFVHTTTSYRRIPAPKRRRAHEQGTPAVLIVDVRDPSEPLFLIVCAIHEGFGLYNFDTFYSTDDSWTEIENELTLEKPCRIVASSGVSNSQGMAFWLTTFPYKVVMYAMDDTGEYTAEVIELPDAASIHCRGDAWPRMQLGTLLSNGIVTLAVSCRSDLMVFVRLGTKWWCTDCIDVRREDEDTEINYGCDDNRLEVVCRPPVRKPELMRFVNELPMFAGGRMLVMEFGDFEHQIDRLVRLHEMPEWVRMPPDVRDCVPFVTSRLVAKDFC